MFRRSPRNLGINPMSTRVLMSRNDAEALMAKLFEVDSRYGHCEIYVREENAFNSKFLNLGKITLQTKGMLQGGENPATLIRHGAFEWQVPSEESTRAELLTIFDNNKKEKANDDAYQVLRQTAEIGVRSGLLHPTFDPRDVEEMPLRSSQTVVSDTSGVLAGPLDFVVRQFPVVRVKIPAIVHMEIVNMANRFHGIRKNLSSLKGKKGELLIARMRSQGGHRALLRLELRSDTEVERTFLLGDPLRSAFARDNDGDVAGLNLQRSVRAYADRLILESARHHQAQSGPNHMVRLLTGDKEFASMALAEGVSPLFFRMFNPSDFFGQTLTGQTFDPFSGHLLRTPLSIVLWELATAFGEVRLRNASNCVFEIHAFDQYRQWTTDHAIRDLLWCLFEPASEAGTQQSTTRAADTSESTTGVAVADTSVGGSKGETISAHPVYFQRFNCGRLIQLISALDDRQKLSLSEVMDLLNTKSPVGANEYRRFLLAGDIIAVQDTAWMRTDRLTKLSTALKNERISEFRGALLVSPSFRKFSEIIGETTIGNPIDISPLKRAANTYSVLGEITFMAAPVPPAGLFPTPNVPDAAEFATIAKRRYNELNHGAELVSTGAWLELLIRGDGIHPEIARNRLDDASRRGFLQRSTEGSTTQARYSDHILHVVRVQAGIPYLKPIHLYRGDYLIEGKSSVSLRIAGSGT